MTGVNAATIKIAIEVDDKGSVKIRQLGRSTQDAGDQADRSFKKAGRSLGDFDQKVSAAITKLAKFMAVTLAAAAAAGVAALALVSKQSVKLASDLEETQNKFNVVFRGMTGQAEAWAKVLQDSYIMTREESKRYLASVQDLLVPMGMAREEAGALSFEIVKLSADMGSFNNVPTAQVMADIQSALVGNYETMKKYGVVLNATTVQEKALAMGLAATKDELTAAHRAQAAYQLILAGSADAIGDISRSSESYANQMRLLNKNITEMKTTLGEALLPVLSKMLVDFNTWFKLNEDLIRQNIEEWGKKVATVIETIGKMAGWTLERLYNFSNFIAILDAIKEGELSFWKAATMGPKEAEVWLERYAARQRLANLEMASSHLTANELAVSHGKVAEAATASGDAQVKAAGEATKALGKLDKAILDTGRSYNLQVAAYMEGTDVLTRNIIDRSDQMEAEERERMARVSTAVEEFYGDIYDMAEDHADGVRQLNELLVNDMGRIFDTYINDVLHGQIRSVKDLFEGLFKSILDMFTRLLSQMAANSLVDALFGKGASGGLTLGSLTTGGGLLDKVLGGGSLAKNAASAGKWLGGLLGIGGAASAPALLAPGAAGAALYPAVGVATSGTGYAVGMGGMGTGAAATTGAGATTTSSGGMALGLAPWMAPAAVGAIGLGLWAKFVFGDKKPTTTELMNQMALTPEDYAFAIGTAFTEAMDPVYGILQNHMMNAQGTALTTWNQFETEFRDVQTRIYDHTTGQWQDLAYSGQVLFAMMRGDVVSEMDAMAMEVETGIAGLAEQLVSASEQLVSASEQLVSASEQMQTGLDKARGAMQDMGVSGGYLKRAMDLADRALQSAGNSTEALQAYLEGLGLSADDIATVLEYLSADMDNAASSMVRAASGIDRLIAGLDSLAGAQPGAVEGNAEGGLLRGGSGTRDDLYLGTVGGRAQLAMGGEYIVNARSTAKHLQLLDRINADRYAGGGAVPLSTIRGGDNPAAIEDMMRQIARQLEMLGKSGLELELLKLNYELRDTVRRAKELGASEKDLADIRKLSAIRIDMAKKDAWTAELEAMTARDKAYTDFVSSIEEQIAAMAMSDQEKAVAATVSQMNASLEKARELGLAERDLAKIRELQALQEAEILSRGLKQAVEAMRQFRNSLSLTGEEAARSAEAQKQLFDVLAQARGGDFSGVEAIGDVLRDISINKADYATAADYARVYWSVMHAVADIEKLASAKVPGFADGGDFTGGWRVVGERGPELEYTGPSRIYNRAQAGELINIDALVVEVRELRREVSAGNYQVAKNTGKTARHVERWEAIGMPQERVA